MNEQATNKIAFEVETSRILEILASEIYDSPKAFLRENVQNAYDAILMRCTEQDLPLTERKIEIIVEPNLLTIRDDGIGMTEEVLRENFWKAGSSGKKTDLAQRSGVIGTFGIGAMANFGVCTALRVETRHIESDVTLVSSAKREDLQISQECIDLERVEDEREPGTLVVADLDPSFSIDEAGVCNYLKQYVRFLPVSVTVNGNVISLEKFEDTLAGRAQGFELISSRQVSQGEYAGTLDTLVGSQARILAWLTDVTLSNSSIEGEIFFVQQEGQTLGFRNLFGLAPIPVSGTYDFGGFVNLNMLHPTAGREALSRESIQHVANLTAMIEAEVSIDMAQRPEADQNQQFQQYILSHGKIDLAGNVKITVMPSRDEVRLAGVMDYEPAKKKHHYAGRDDTILKRFGNEQTNLFHVSQANPRRKLQLRYLSQITNLEQVPEKTIVDRIPQSQLAIDEAMFLVRLRGILLDDYLMPDVNAAFAEISHGVVFDVQKKEEVLYISIARNFPAVTMVVECYKTARDVFEGFVKDFVREHVYPQIRDHVPSSTRQGRDALLRRLQQNKELFRLHEDDYGEVESLLADYLAGKAEFDEVIRASGRRISTQRQEVRGDQIGTVEQEFPNIVGTDQGETSGSELDAAPPIMRTDQQSDMKVLTVAEQYQKLNNFQMFLAVSDRMAKREGEFLYLPHTTKLIWGAHRVIYIFTDATGELSLYYDIELKEPLKSDDTGGAMLPTTTIVTKNRIYIPVPKALEPAFQVADGVKEFYVRFDTIP